jgi:HAD superfamily hydrolase (TIGR01548 family)
VPPSSSRHSRRAKLPAPKIIIFDVDGVLVDVRESFHRTVIETVLHFTGKRVSPAEIHQWKNRSGFNDDWTLSHAWVQSLGFKNSYDEVKSKFVEIYWGAGGKPGNAQRERWLLPAGELRRLAKLAELGLFTGRVRRELDFTLARVRLRDAFQHIVTVEDVSRPKPDPEGLLAILNGRDPATAVYLGDNIDDARAAQAAGVPFLGVLPHRSQARAHRAKSLSDLGALSVLGSVRQLRPWLRANTIPSQTNSSRISQQRR